MDPVPIPESKPWYQSKTVWINGITLGIAVLSLVSIQAGADGKPLLDPVLLPYILMASSVGNTVLRFLTTGAVSIK